MSDENIWDGHKSDDNKNDDFCELDDAGGLSTGVLTEVASITSFNTGEVEVESSEIFW